MKTIVIISVLTMLAIGALAQSSIKVYSILKAETSHVLLYLNDVQQDAQYDAESEISGLTAGTYELRVCFNSDTIADVFETIELPADTQIIFRVEEKTAMGKELGLLGRSLGRVFGTVNSDDAEGLTEFYKLVKISSAKIK